MRRNITFLTLLLSLLFLLSGCGGEKLPTKADIMADLAGEINSVEVKNPYIADRYDTYELSITGIEIEKSRTEKTSYTAYCSVDMKNEFYTFTKYVKCEYGKYDDGKWMLNSCEEYRDAKYAVTATPFEQQDVINNLLEFPFDFTEDSTLEAKAENHLLTYICEYELPYEYEKKEYHLEQKLEFRGDYWEILSVDRNVNHVWDIEGSWKQNENEAMQIGLGVIINAFDKKSRQASGEAWMQGDPFSEFARDELAEYDLAEANIYENNRGFLIMEFSDGIQIYFAGNVAWVEFGGGDLVYMHRTDETVGKPER